MIGKTASSEKAMWATGSLVQQCCAHKGVKLESRSFSGSGESYSLTKEGLATVVGKSEPRIASPLPRSQCRN
eukprot:3869722-Amphidinium_carterae.1